MNKLDRSRIAQKVFQDPELLQSLEKLLHPAVYREIEEQYQTAKLHQAVLLFLSLKSLCCLKADGEEILMLSLLSLPILKFAANALKKRQDMIKKNLINAWPDNCPAWKKPDRADYVIQNNGSLNDLQQTIKELYT